MATRQPLTWLVIAYLDNQVLLGRARYDGEDDLLTVTTLKHGGDATRVARGDLQGLSMQLLMGLYEAKDRLAYK